MGTLFQIAAIIPHHRFITDTKDFFLLRPGQVFSGGLVHLNQPQRSAVVIHVHILEAFEVIQRTTGITSRPKPKHPDSSIKQLNIFSAIYVPDI